MSYDFWINFVEFYASEETNWQPFGVLTSTTVDGRPNTNGQAAFAKTLRAIANNDTVQIGMGAPFETSGTFRQLVGVWVASAAQDYVQTYRAFDPTLNEYVQATGILDIAHLLSKLTGGAALQDVPIVVDSLFPDGADRSGYYGGEPFPDSTSVEYIPGDPLPTGDPALTYGWGIGRWGYGLWGQGEGE